MKDNQNKTGFLDFLKSVSDWPQPEVWFDADDREIVVDWSRGPHTVATVIFGEDLMLSRWSICSSPGVTTGGGSEIPPDSMLKIKEIALSE